MPDLSASADVALSQIDGTLTGRTDASLSGQALSAPLNVNVDGTIEPNDLDFSVTGQALGGPLEGNALLNEGNLDLSLTGRDLDLPTLAAPATLSLNAQGPVTELPLNVELTPAEPTPITLGSLTLGENAAGQLSAVLDGTTLRDIRGQVGPVGLEGQASLDGNGSFTYTVEETPVAGPVQGDIALTNGTLELQQGTVSGQADLTTSALSGSGVTLPPLDAGLNYRVGEEIDVSLSDVEAGLEASYQGNRVTFDLRQFPLSTSGQEVTLSGSGNLNPRNVSESLSLDLTGDSALGSLSASGTGSGIDFSLTPTQQRVPSSLQGNFDLLSGTLDLDGTLGEVTVRGSGQVTGEDFGGTFSAQSRGDTLDLTLGGSPEAPTVTAQGQLPLQPLSDLAGVELDGTLSADLQRNNGSYQGSARVQGQAASVPLDLTLTGEGERVRLSGSATPASVPVELSGTVLPEVEVTGSSPYGNVTYRGGEVSGSGSVPEVDAAGFNLPTQPWLLNGSLAEGAILNLPESGSTLRAQPTADGWQLGADINQTLTRGDSMVTLDADAGFSAADGSSSVAGNILVDTPEATATLPVSGSLEGLELTGNLAANTLSQLFDLPVDLAGTVDVNAQAQPLGGLEYSADANWQAEGQMLSLNAQGGAEPFRAEVQGDGLELSYSGADLNVQASNFALGAFVTSPNVAGTLDGNLNRAADGWDGDLTLAATTPVDAQVALSGEGESLGVVAGLEQNALTATAQGNLLPDLNLNVSGAYAELADLSGGVTGSLAQPAFDLILITAAVQQEGAVEVTVPAQTQRISGSFEDGLNLNVTGDALNFLLEDGTLTGTFNLPFTLEGQAQQLQADIGGSPNAPTLSGALTGPVLSGPIAVQDDRISSSLTLNSSVWLETLPISATPVSAEITSDFGLNWQANLTGSAEVRELPIVVVGELAGAGLEYGGDALVTLAGNPVPVSVAGAGADVEATARLETIDLASFAPALPVDPTGTLGGVVTFDSSAATPLSYTLDAAGQVSDQPFDLSAVASEAQPFRLGGSVGEVELLAERADSASGYSLRASSSSGATPFELAGGLELTPNLSLNLSGSYDDQPATVQASYAAEAGTANMDAAVGNATLQLAALSSDGTWTVTSEAAIPADSPLPITGRADAAASFQEGVFTVERLNLTTVAGERDVTAQLAGAITPTPDLSGQVTVTGFDPVQVAALQVEGGYRLELQQNDLTLAADLSPTFSPSTLTLTGDAQLPVGPGVALRSDLTWNPQMGFAGEATLAAEVDAGRLDLAAVGAGGLSVGGNIQVGAEEVGSLLLELSDNPLARPELSGTVSLQGDVGSVVPAFTSVSAEPLGFAGELMVGGTLSQPILQGPLSLRGALDAEGSVNASAQGAGLELTGEGLAASASLDAAGWQLEADTDALDLTALLPQLASPKVTARLRGRQAWGEAPTVTAETLLLETPNSRVSGEISYLSGTFNGRLSTDFDLSDLQLGPQLVGTVGGDLSLGTSETGAPFLGGVLEASGLSVAGQGAVLGGSLLLSGPVSAPNVTARLRGGGTASGTLFASLTPGSYTVTSDLVVGELTSDLYATLDTGADTTADTTADGGADGGAAATAVSATGQVSFGDYVLTLSESKENSRVVELDGENRLAGWQARLDVVARQLALSGPLATLSPQLAGTLDLTANGAADRWLSGTVSDVAAGPLEVGTLTLSGGAGRTVSIRGDTLEAQVDLAARQWSLTRASLPLPGELTASFAGSGSATSAELNGTLRGEVSEEALELPLLLTYEDGRLGAASTGELLGGEVDLDVSGSPATGWSGAIELNGVTVGGAATSLSGSVAGPFAAPILSAQFSAGQDAANIAGSLSAAAAGVTVDALVSANALSAPLNVAGTLFPEPALTLTTLEAAEPTANTEQTLLLTVAEGVLSAEGELTLAAGPGVLELSAASPSDWLVVRLSSPQAPGLALQTKLPAVAPATLLSLLAEGVALQGVRDTTGAVTFDPVRGVRVQALNWRTPAGTLEVGGSVTTNPVQAQLSGTWRGRAAAGLSPYPWLTSLSNATFEVEADTTHVKLTARGEGSTLDASYDLTEQAGSLAAQLSPAQGALSADLTYSARAGPAGTLTATAFPLFESDAAGNTSLDAALELTPEAVSGTAQLTVDGGTVSEGTADEGTASEGKVALEGQLGWGAVLPNTLAPAGADTQQLSARFERFDPGTVPWVARRLASLDAPLNGELLVTSGRLSGQVTSAELSVGERTLPLELALGGSLRAPALRGSLGRTTFDVGVEQGDVTGLVRFEAFPLDTAVEATLGPTDVVATLTGALRFDIPQGDLSQSYLRFASEDLTLEQGGDVTQGELSFELRDGGLSIQNASFTGDGSWQASGTASTELLNLRFDAREADFGPLLSLVPQLVGLDVGALGTVQLVTSGSLLNPVVQVSSPDLEISLGGTGYRLDGVSLNLQNNDFVTSGRVEAVAPLTGALTFSGGGRVQFAPERTFDFNLRFAGNPAVPVIGTISDLNGTVTARPGEPWRLASTGSLGNPFTLSGTLSPLDLSLTGQDLNLRAPQYFLSSSSADADLRFYRDDLFVLSGALAADRAVLALAGRQPAATNTANAANATSGATPRPARNPVLSRITFDNLSVRAQQQVTFQENFGSAELGNIDLTLGGTAAAPFLSGQAQALRGKFQFAGREFDLQGATAGFEPARGIFPVLDIVATTSFAKTKVNNDLPDLDVDFVRPADSQNFDVVLELQGDIEPARQGPQAFKANIDPSLSSDAVIQVQPRSGELASGAGCATEATSAPRALSEAELFSLLSLGRLELCPDEGVASSLAQGAVDTAVDYFILSSLQQELGDALGLDLFELRTTSLGSLLTEGGSFGVSLLVGGYLSDEIFASYEVNSLGLEEGVSLRNEFTVRYDLAPLEFTLAGRLDLFRDPSADPLPEFDLSLGYAFSQRFSLETGVQLSTAAQGVSFGVNLRW